MITPSYHKILFIFMIFAFAAHKQFLQNFLQTLRIHAGR